MTLKEIYETGLKNEELGKLLSDNGWSYVDFCNWVSFAKGMGYIN